MYYKPTLDMHGWLALSYILNITGRIVSMPKKLSISEKKHPLVAETWSHRHDLVVMLQCNGMTNNEISIELGFDESYISRIVNDPRGIKRLEEFRTKLIAGIEDAGQKLQALAVESAERAGELMRQDGDLGVAARSAFGILDRAGYSTVEKHLHAHVQFSEDKVNKLLEMTEKANKVSGRFNYSDVEEVEVEEVGSSNGSGQTRGAA